MKIYLSNGFQEISDNDVKKTEFVSVGRGFEPAILLSYVDWDDPFITEAKPGSIITGLLNLTIFDKEYKFNMLGNSLLQSVEFPNVYYNIGI